MAVPSVIICDRGLPERHPVSKAGALLWVATASAAGGGYSEQVSGCRNTAVTEQTTACDGNADVAKGIFDEANELVDEYIYFYNNERIQLKTGQTPMEVRYAYAA